MRIAFVHAFPIYHDGVSTEEWLTRLLREQWMAEYLAELGHEVEYWAVGERREDRAMPMPENPRYQFRIFPPDRRAGRTRTHVSSELTARAREFEAHLHLVKGVDGGVGRHLLRTYLFPEKRPIVFILGGGHYSPDVSQSSFVLCQTERQRIRLKSPGLRVWRKAVPVNRLLLLPKSLDTDLFRPVPGTVKEWDVFVACRLLRRLKNLDVLGPLSRRFRVAVAGTGTDGPRLRKRHRRVCWLGYVPYREMPQYLNRARLFMHTGVREESPKTITEAMACGLPVVAFAPSISREILPSECGLLVRGREYLRPIAALLQDADRMRSMGHHARDWAQRHFHKESYRQPLAEILRRLGKEYPSWPD
jgi:glycosyltransferase involved in cell wall biosynthesis